jgi:hypothetical protein
MPSLSSIVPYIADNKASWKNEVHRRQWASTLKTYVHPVIGHLPVAGVDTAMVLKILRPIWNTKPETANRVRGRIEAILDWAKTHTYRQGDNPARWKGHLDNVLPKRSKVRRVRHHPALRTLMFPSSWRNCATTAGRTGAVTLTQRLVRAQQNGFLVDKDIPEHLWTAAALGGIVEHHGADIVQNVAASAIQTALADPGQRAGKPIGAESTTNTRHQRDTLCMART